MWEVFIRNCIPFEPLAFCIDRSIPLGQSQANTMFWRPYCHYQGQKNTNFNFSQKTDILLEYLDGHVLHLYEYIIMASLRNV